MMSRSLGIDIELPEERPIALSPPEIEGLGYIVLNGCADDTDNIEILKVRNPDGRPAYIDRDIPLRLLNRL